MCFSRDGCYAWSDTAEVFDVKTKQRVAQWTNRADGEGSPVMSSEFFELHRRGGGVDLLDAKWDRLRRSRVIGRCQVTATSKRERLLCCRQRDIGHWG